MRKSLDSLHRSELSFLTRVKFVCMNHNLIHIAYRVFKIDDNLWLNRDINNHDGNARHLDFIMSTLKLNNFHIASPLGRKRGGNK